MVSSAAVQCDRTTVEITYNVCNWNRWIQWLSKLLGDLLDTLSTVSMVNSVAVEGGKTSLKLPPMCKLKQVNSVDIQVYRTSTEYTLWAWWIQWLSKVTRHPLIWFHQMPVQHKVVLLKLTYHSESCVTTADCGTIFFVKSWPKNLVVHSTVAFVSESLPKMFYQKLIKCITSHA